MAASTARQRVPVVVVVAAALAVLAAFQALSASPPAPVPTPGEPARGVCTIGLDSGITLADIAHARTEAERRRGLSFTDDIGTGMFFSWTASAPREMWMRDTRVALDLVWVDPDRRLFGPTTMAPMSDRRYRSGSPAIAAIELEAGQLAEYGIRGGETIISVACHARRSAP